MAVSGGIVFPTITWNRNTEREFDGEVFEGVEHISCHMLLGNIHFLSKETFTKLVDDMVEGYVKRGFKVICVWSAVVIR